MLKLIPSADRVIIKPDPKAEARKAGSIFLPDSFWQEHRTGTVIAVGPGPTGETGRCPMTSKPGDKVVFAPALGRPISISPDSIDEEYYVIRQHEIQVTITEEVTGATSKIATASARAAKAKK